jgi:beta-galactosidase
VGRGDGEIKMLQQVHNNMESHDWHWSKGWYSGDALWSMFDYQAWSHDPLCASGCMDLWRLPKYSAWFYRSQRDPATIVPNVKSGPVVFIASNWTAQSQRPVKVYSNCDSVSLYLNDTLVATQAPAVDSFFTIPRKRFVFAIPSFKAGVLRADGRIGGTVRTTYSVRTPGTASKLAVTIDTAGLKFKADGSDIAIVYASLLDNNRSPATGASNSVTFSVTGPGTLIGNNPVAAEAGIACILLQSKSTAGTISVTAQATGLTSGSATVASVNDNTGTGPITRTARAVPMQRPAVLKVTDVRFVMPVEYRQGKNLVTFYDLAGKVLQKTASSSSIINISKGSTKPAGVYIVRIDPANR